MSKTIRYTGEFFGRNGTLYRCEIWQEGTFTASEIRFPARDQLKIEWKADKKIDPLIPSAATLVLNCDNYRQFYDLYTIDAGSIRLDIYRSDILYWSGTLNTELYEEPNIMNKYYDVTLTFSDFSILDRYDFDMDGFHSLEELINTALNKTGINYKSIVYYIGTQAAVNTDGLVKDISVLSDNFYDEDGTPYTWHKVIEEVLKVFSLRMINKGGRIIVYDFATLLTSVGKTEILYNDTDARIITDDVYNDVKLTFSPYSHTSMIDASVDVDSVSPVSSISVPIDQSSDNASLTGFEIGVSDSGEGMVKSQGKFFKITPGYSGNEESGIAWTIRHCVNGTYSNALGTSSPQAATSGRLLMPPKRTFIAATQGNDKYKLRITLSMLADTRFNPFESESLNNEQGNYDEMNARCNLNYIPFRLTLFDGPGDDANAICHYVNSNVKSSGSIPAPTGWVSGQSTSWSDAWMAWYDVEDRKGKSGLGGWQTNRPCIGIYSKGLPAAYTKPDPGEYVLLPKLSGVYKSGWLQLEVGDGLYCYGSSGNLADIYGEINWLLYKDLKMTLCDRNFKDVATKDVILTAWINKNAKEKLSIDTIIGSLDTPHPTALAQLYYTSTHGVCNSFTRSQVTDTIERLLIGTIYSNYATRHSIFKGTVNLIPEFALLTDASEADILMALNEIQDLQAEESDIQMTRVDPDDYKGVKYE